MIDPVIELDEIDVIIDIDAAEVVVDVDGALPATLLNLTALLDGLPDYTDDEAAALDSYTGMYYFLAPGTDIGLAGTLKKRLDI